MHRRPSAAATPLSVQPLTPRHRDLASLKSPDSAPHTPTKRAEPLPVFSTNTNRYSTDSWNSSNCDGAEEMTFEWKPEQILLLARTLDALPCHLLTPFAGPVPPSNLLNKLALGVTKAKNSVEWPHSLRATRAKIIELARHRAKENIQDGSGSDTIVEEESDSNDGPLQQTTNIGPKRPLYKPSSTDFNQPPKFDIKDNPNLTRLSRRLQRTDRILASPTYEPYPRTSTPSLRPSTPSSLTLNSTISPRPSRILKRTTSSLSNGSDEFLHSDAVPRKLRRSDTFAGSALFPMGLKRAPSYGGSSRNSCTSLESVAMSIDFDAKDSDVTSDEEERLRGKKAKRARRKEASPTPTPSETTPTNLASPIKPTPRSKASKNPSTQVAAQNDENVEKRVTKKKTTFQRLSGIIGPELPNPQPTPASPARAPTRRKTETPVRAAELSISPMHISSPYNITSIPTVSPSKGVKRSRPLAPLPRANLARKISFTNLAAFSDDHAGSGAGLGSAFQMH